MWKPGIILLLFAFMEGAIAGGYSREPDFVKALQDKVLAFILTPKMLDAKAVPQDPRYCIRCVAGLFMDHEWLLRENVTYKLMRWREEWNDMDCMQEEQVVHQWCAGTCVTVIVERKIENGFEAEGVLQDCSDDLFRWGTDLPLFVGARYMKNESFTVERHDHRIKYDFTWDGNDDAVHARRVAKRILHRHLYDYVGLPTIIIYISFAVIFALVLCCFTCWFLKDACKRRRQRREHARVTYVAMTPITMDLETESLKKSNTEQSEKDVEGGEVADGASQDGLPVESFMENKVSACGEDAILGDRVEGAKKEESDHDEFPDNMDIA